MEDFDLIFDDSCDLPPLKDFLKGQKVVKGDNSQNKTANNGEKKQKKKKKIP